MCELEPMGPAGDGWRIPESMWQRIEPLLPRERPHPKGGRRYTPARQCMDGIFYVFAHRVPVESRAQGLRRIQYGPSAVSTVAGCWCI